MTEFKVVLSASYNISAGSPEDAEFEAICQLADEIDEMGLSISTIRKLFGANTEVV